MRTKIAKTKITKQDEGAAATEREYADYSTYRVEAARAIAQFEVAQIDADVLGMRTSIAGSLQRKAELTSRIAGLDAVLGKR